MTLDAATCALLTEMGESGSKPLHEMTPDEARGLAAALAAMYGEGPEVHATNDLSAPARDGHAIPLRVLRPSEHARGVIVYYHGGGWTMGALPEFETLGRELAVRTGCTVVLVDYRLAPEHRYPVAVDDSWDALRWVALHIQDLAAGSAPLILAGDSAGGNLVAVLAHEARDAGGPDIELQVMICPVTDCDLDNETYRDPANQLIVTREAMNWYWGHYVPDPAARVDPRVSPARASDLANLAPAIVVVAEHDVLRQEGEHYAQLLTEAGVPVELRVFDGQMHDFLAFVNVLPGSADGIAFVADAISRQLDS